MITREERNNFSLMVEAKAIEQNVSHMEIILDYCEATGLEVEVAATLVNQSLKAKIENEARDLKFLPKGSKLPL